MQVRRRRLGQQRLEQWSRADGLIHRLDPRIKLLAVLALLVFIATAQPWSPAAFVFYAALLLAVAAAAGLPLAGMLARVALVLPFPTAVAGMTALTGDSARALTLLSKSVLSTFAVVLLMAATGMPALAGAAQRLGAPRMLVTVVQFLYRYLFVLFDQATRVRNAMLCRGGFRWDAAGGAVAGLFASSYGRAERVHMAMVARGYEGGPLPDSRAHAGAKGMAAAEAAATLIVLIALAGARILWGF